MKASLRTYTEHRPARLVLQLLSIARMFLSYIYPSILPSHVLCLSGPATDRHKPVDFAENVTIHCQKWDFRIVYEYSVFPCDFYFSIASRSQMKHLFHLNWFNDNCNRNDIFLRIIIKFKICVQFYACK